MKFVFIGGGTAGVALVQIVNLSGAAPAWIAAGAVATALLLAGFIFVYWTESDAPRELTIAAEALARANEAADQYRAALGSVAVHAASVDRASHLLSAIQLMRESLEQAAASSLRDPVEIIAKMLRMAKGELPLAMGVRATDEWTMSIYRAQPDGEGSTELRCIAHLRAVDCDVSEARPWPEGVSVAGNAYANGREATAEDMSKVASVYALPAGLQRGHDAERYKSVVSVPISVNRGRKPWGVVNGTNNVVGHFPEKPGPGVGTAETIRALAGMVALAVAISATAPPTQGA